MTVDTDVLHDIFYSALDNAIRDKIDTVLARVAHNLGEDVTKQAPEKIKAILTALATLPGEHWMPDPE